MELSKRAQLIITIVCVAVLVLLLVAALVRQSGQPAATSKAPADEKTESTVPSIDSKAEDTKTSDKKEAASSADTSSGYAYTAQPGDSYTLFARQAVSSYAAKQKLTLTADKALLAEVDLTNAAGSPELEVGQKVTIAAADVAKVVGQEKASAAKTDTSDMTTNTTSAQADGDYQYTAAAGDSYTLFARQAIASYASKHSTTMTAAQRVAAETYMAEAAAFPTLEIGQQVSVAASTVKSAVDRATQLSAGQQATWQPYAIAAGL